MIENIKSGKYPKSRKSIKTIEYKHNHYHVHIEHVMGGVQGYIVADGDFICALPLADNEERLLLEADKRLEGIV